MKFLNFFTDIRKKYNINISDVIYIVSKVIDVPINKVFMVDDISQNNIDKIVEICKLYNDGMPLNKIFKEQNFYGFDFYVDQNVLAPRPETEILVEKTISLIKTQCKVLDICCGTGCIGISVKKICPQADITMSDISQFAIDISKFNAKKNNVDVNILKSDMFFDIPKQKFDYILSNPPYIKENDKNVSKEVLLYDPHIALFGGEDGLKFYKIIFENAQEYLKDDGKIIIEIGYDTLEGIKSLSDKYCLCIEEIIKDYSDIDRIIVLTKRKILC